MRYWLITMIMVGTIMVIGVGCGQKKGELLASVGGHKITTTDFKVALSNLPENYKILAESYKGKRKILDNLVKKDLLVQEAQRRGYQSEKEIKDKIKSIKQESKQKLKQQIKAIQDRLAIMDRQVYENVMLGELNQRLKKEGVAGIEITKDEISTYYEDYARKLKILNPAAKVPALKLVEAQIEAILVEEALLKKLKKASKVEVKEIRFRELYGDKEDILIEP